MKNDQKEISENEIKEQELLEKLAKKQQLTEEEMKSLKGGSPITFGSKSVNNPL